MSVTIRTDNRPRPLFSWCDLTEKERKEFDYIEDPEATANDRFMRYKRWVYDLHQALPVGRIEPFKGWTGYMPDSFYSGVLFKYIGDDADQVVAATYIS